MAAEVGVEGIIRRSLFLCRLDILGKIDSDDQQRYAVRKIFNGIDGLVRNVCDQYGSVRHLNSHVFMDMWPMAERTLFRVHEAILRRLRSTPTSTTPWFCTLTREVPFEVFNLILNQVISHNSFGHTTTETTAVIRVLVIDDRKLSYIFNRMNDEQVRVPRNELLMKTFEDTSYAKVVVNEEYNFIFKYNKNSEVLTVSFNYGFWNAFGIAQH